MEKKPPSVADLFDAIANNNTKLVAELLKKGVDPQGTARHDRRTPAHDAVRGQRAEALQLLITAGADINKANINGRSPAHVAVIVGNTEALQSLITAGADINLTDDNGDTALTLAASRTYIETCRHLLLHGAGVDEESGQTAVDVAEQNGDTHLATYFREFKTIQDMGNQKEPVADYCHYHGHFPNLLSMSPDGLDYIITQGATLFNFNAMPSFHEELQLTDYYMEKDEDCFEFPALPLVIRTEGTRSPLPTPRNASSLFDVDPVLQTPQPFYNHPLHSDPSTEKHQESSIKSSHTEKVNGDKIQSLQKKLQEKDNIIEEHEETIAQKGDKIKHYEQTITNKGDRLVLKGDEIKKLTEKIEETGQQLTHADRQLKGKGKRLYEHEEVIKEQNQQHTYKDKIIALKTERIAQMEKYQELLEEQSNKAKIGTDDNEIANNQKQSLYATKADYQLTPQQSKFILDQIIPSICRIDVPGFAGTGFIVGGICDLNTGLTHRYMLTCYHVNVQDALRDQQSCIAKFESMPNPTYVKVLNPALFWNKDMDYVLLKLEPSQALEQLLSGKVALGQLVTVDDPEHNDALVLCAHTAGQVIDWGARAVCIDDSEVTRKHGDLSLINQRRQHRQSQLYPLTKKFTYYDCSCKAGTSGAPCLSAPQQRLYAMHCGSIYKESLEMEYGISIKCVVHDIADNISNWASIPGASNMQQGGLWLDQLSELFPRLSPVIFPNTAMNVDDNNDT